MQDVGESFFDAFIFVFSVDDVETFERAEEAMRRLRHDLGSDRPIVLVANKIDLVRNRKVTSEGTFSSWYTVCNTPEVTLVHIELFPDSKIMPR